jgi:hypothetical protein
LQLQQARTLFQFERQRQGQNKVSFFNVLTIASAMSNHKKTSSGLQRIGCDFNAFSLSEERGDSCFYAFEREYIGGLASLVGSRVLLFAHDSPSEITACEAVIEPYRSGWRGEPNQSFWYCGFRARPVEGTWYSGPALWPQERSL